MSIVANVMEFFNINEERANKELELAQNDLKELKTVVERAKTHKMPLADLCQLVGGHNLDDSLFDVNFGKNILATVTKDYKVCNDLEMYIDSVSTSPIEISLSELELFVKGNE